MSYECYIFRIRRVHRNLVITRKNIHKWQHFMPQSGINNLVNTWQWEIIFWERLVQVSKVNKNPSFVFFFLAQPLH